MVDKGIAVAVGRVLQGGMMVVVNEAVAVR